MPDGNLVPWLLLLSGVTFIVSLVLVPFLLVRMPADYFVRKRRTPTYWGIQHPVLRLTLMLLKNLVGVVLVIGGVLMLFTPGQGVLSILLGLAGC